MSDAVRQLLQAEDARIQRLERDAKRIAEDIREARVKRAAFATALTAMGEPVPPLPGQEPHDAGARRKRGISEFWVRVLREMDRKGKMSISEVISMADLLGTDMTAAAVRSQLSYYTMAPRAFVRRIAPGVYELTDSGKALLESQKGEDPAGTGSSDATNLVESEQTRTDDPGEGTK